MAEQQQQTVTETVVADDAERARAAADQAAEAARATEAAAASSSARVVDAAAQEITQYEERLASCQSEIETLKGALSADREATKAMVEAHRAELREQLQSIQSRLAPPPEPPPNPPPDRTAAGESHATPPEGTAPEPERPPERRRAHRWI